MIAAALLALAGCPETPQPVTYELSPVITDGALEKVRVTIRLIGDSDGETTLELPDRYAYADNYWRFVSDVSVEGTEDEALANGEHRLRHPACEPLTVSYGVASAYDADPKGTGENPYDGAVVRPTWFAAEGEMLFASIEGRGNDPARFSWQNWPSNWRHIASADPVPGHTLTADQLIETNLLAAPDLQLFERSIEGGTLRFGARGRFGFDLNEAATTLARTISAQRRSFTTPPARTPSPCGSWAVAERPKTLAVTVGTMASHFTRRPELRRTSCCRCWRTSTFTTGFRVGLAKWARLSKRRRGSPKGSPTSTKCARWCAVAFGRRSRRSPS